MAVTVQDYSVYKTEILRQRNYQIFYKRLTANPFSFRLKFSKLSLRACVKMKSPKENRLLVHKKSATPVIYTVPKIHQKKIWIPGRLIVLGNYSPLEPVTIRGLLHQTINTSPLRCERIVWPYLTCNSTHPIHTSSLWSPLMLNDYISTSTKMFEKDLQRVLLSFRKIVFDPQVNPFLPKAMGWYKYIDDILMLWTGSEQ